MKKILALVTGAALLLTASLFTACDGLSNVDESYSSDTIVSLSAPSVTAKAYPGANILVWNAVKNADSFTIYRKDSAGLEVKLATTANLYYVDSEVLINKASYTYTVLASNKSNGLVSRAVTTNESSTSVTVTAITAPVLTAALDLAKYENGWNGTVEPTSYPDLSKPENTLSADTVTVTANGKYVIVQFPGKAYLNYTVTDYFGNVLKDADATLKGAQTFVNNALRTYYFIPGAAGDHTLNIVASPLNEAYYTASATIAKTATTTASLSSWTANIVATWEDSSAHIVFTPNTKYATSADTTKYTVYRYVDGTYTALTGTIATEEDGTKFAIDDADASKTIDSKYYVILTVGTDSIAAYNSASLDASGYVSPIGASATDVAATKVAATSSDAAYVKVTFTPNADYADDATLYTVYKYTDDENDWETVGTASAESVKNGQETGKFYVKDTSPDFTVDTTYVVVLKTSTDEGTAVTAKLAAATDAIATIVSIEPDSTGTKVVVTFTPNAAYSLTPSKYAVYKYTDDAETWERVGTASADTDSKLSGKTGTFSATDTTPDFTVDTTYVIVLNGDEASAVSETLAASLLGIESATNLKTVWNDALTQVLVKFTPATDYAEVADLSKYTVYRKVKDSDEEATVLGSPTSAGIEKSNKTKTATDDNGDSYTYTYIEEMYYFYYTDTTADKTVDYTYIVVLTDEGKTGAEVTENLTSQYALDTFTTLTLNGSAYNLDGDNVKNDVILYVVTDKDVTASELTLYKATKNQTVNTNQNSEWEKVTVEWEPYDFSNTNGCFQTYIKDLDVGTAYRFYVVCERDGYAPLASIAKGITINAASVTDASISATRYSTTSSYSTFTPTNIAVTVNDSVPDTTETAANYTYTVAYTTLVADDVNSRFVFADWSDEKTVSMTETRVGYWSGVLAYTSLDDGIYAFRVTKTDTKYNVSTYSYSNTVMIQREATTSADTVIDSYSLLSFSATATTSGVSLALEYEDELLGTDSENYWYNYYTNLYGYNSTTCATTDVVKENYTWKVYRAKVQHYEQVESYSEVSGISFSWTGTTNSLPNASDNTTSVSFDTGYKGTATDTAVKNTDENVYVYYYLLVGTNKEDGSKVYRNATAYVGN